MFRYEKNNADSAIAFVVNNADILFSIYKMALQLIM